MNTDIKAYITRSSQTDWMPLNEDGVNTEGIFVRALRYDKDQNRFPTIMLKFEAGAVYPYHDHPDGEEVFVLEGDVLFNEEKLSAGDYLYTPPGFKHKVKSENGCVLLFVVPEEVKILKVD